MMRTINLDHQSGCRTEEVDDEAIDRALSKKARSRGAQRSIPQQPLRPGHCLAQLTSARYQSSIIRETVIGLEQPHLARTRFHECAIHPCMHYVERWWWRPIRAIADRLTTSHFDDNETIPQPRLASRGDPPTTPPEESMVSPGGHGLDEFLSTAATSGHRSDKWYRGKAGRRPLAVKHPGTITTRFPPHSSLSFFIFHPSTFYSTTTFPTPFPCGVVTRTK